MKALRLALAIVMLSGCAGTAWPKTAGETTCTEWTSQMTADQRSALGAAMLLALRANDGGTVRPRDDVMKAFTTAISDVCKATPAAKISAVGATIYGYSKGLQP
ncbi:MAG: hypothetical protein HYX55_01570 [Chloroflexi bacterium]|nr:hypothetical protein [Chloroflexota bacterium]